MKRRPFTIAILVATTVLVGTVARAGQPFRYAEGKHDRGELRYVNDIPILLVQGAPTEIGEQIGALALKQLSDVKKLGDQFVGETGFGSIGAIVLKSGSLLLPQFPPDHLKELDSAAKSAGWPRELLIFGNTYVDIRKGQLCSALIVEGERNATGGPLFGRNLDWGGSLPLHEYTLVTVYRPTGKHAFVSIGFPGMIGCASGMNDAGLAVAANTVSEASDGSASFDLKGVPQGLALRRVLEECTTVDEAAKLLRSLPRTTMENFVICDRHRGAVFEVTTKQIVVREATDAVCACTNHFRTRELAENTRCPRYEILDASRRMLRLTLEDVAGKMDAVAGDMTLQTMIFEPAILKLHLAFGEPPASQFPLQVIDLTKLFTSGEYPTGHGVIRRDRPAALPHISRNADGNYDVTFRFRPVNNPAAKTVYLAGTFNDWKPTAWKMAGPDKDGDFETTVRLPQGRHEYKFVINGQLWRRDLNNDAQAGPNRNSVIEVRP